tara:strand:+ start:739 stop:2541 length:1803 start_codon:yes stop_codon:yes gene_type:complete
LAEEDVKVHYNWETEDIEEEELKKEEESIKNKPEKKKIKKLAKKGVKSKKKIVNEEEKPSIEEEKPKEEESFKEKQEQKEEQKKEGAEEQSKGLPEQSSEKLSEEALEEQKTEKSESAFTKEDLTSTEEDNKYDHEDKYKDKDIYEDNSSKPNYVIAFAAVIIIIILSIFVLRTKNIFPSANNENIVVVVNGEIITIEELEKTYKLTVPEEYSAFITKEDFLNQSLVPEKILLQEAGKKGIKITDEELQQGLEEFLMENSFTKEELENRLKSDDVDYNDFLKNFRIKLTITKLLDEMVSSQIKINDFEIVNYYENNMDKFIAGPGQIRASHILVKSKSLAEDILEELRNGADFAELAKINSIDASSAAFGGDLGFFESGRMVKEFEDAAFSLEIGGFSDIIETEFGYHIIKKGKNEISLEDAKERIRLTLLSSKQSAAIEIYINQLISSSDIIFKLNKDSVADTGFVPAEETARTFMKTSDPICEKDGKPIIRLYTTTWCPHCVWIKDTFDKVAKEYMAQGKIAAYHWDVDSGDNTLTSEEEAFIPKEEIDIFKRHNPDGSIPTFIFGCEYKRIGNGYEAEDDLRAEEAEFREIIEELLA